MQADAQRLCGMLAAAAAGQLPWQGHALALAAAGLGHQGQGGASSSGRQAGGSGKVIVGDKRGGANRLVFYWMPS